MAVLGDVEQPPTGSTGRRSPAVEAPQDQHLRAPPGSPADEISSGVIGTVLVTERERIAHAMNNSVIKPLFAASLVLHGALAQEADDRMHAPVRAAIDELDLAIKAVREAVFDLEDPLDGTTSGVTSGA